MGRERTLWRRSGVILLNAGGMNALGTPWCPCTTRQHGVLPGTFHPVEFYRIWRIFLRSSLILLHVFEIFI